MAVDGGRAERALTEVAVGEHHVVATRRSGQVGPQTAAAAQYRQRLVGGAKPCGDGGAALVLVAVQQGVGGPVVPGLRQLPGQVADVPQPLVDPLRAEGTEQMRGIAGEEGPVDAPAAGQPVVKGVDAGVDQLVRRGVAAPARQGVPHPGHQRLRGDQFAARRQQPVQAPHAVRQGARDDLVAPRRPRRTAVQQRLAGPREFGAQGGHRMAFHRRTAGEADAEELADRRPGAVAADEMAAPPPGARGAAAVRGDAAAVLLQRVEAAVGDEPYEALLGDRVPQAAGERVLRDMQRSGREAVAERQVPHLLPAPHRPPARPTDAVVTQGAAAEPFHQGGRVRAQDDGAGGARLVLSVALVEHDGGDALGREGQGQGQADRARPDHDHRVHEVTPRARRVVRRSAEGARCAITERMQLTAAACVKRHRGAARGGGHMATALQRSDIR
nr:hypothetical protein [Streptomyces sp. V4I23]